MALAQLTSSDVGASARDKINAAIVEAGKVGAKQDAFDLATLLQTVSGLATTASVAALRSDVTTFQAETAQQSTKTSEAIAAKVELSEFVRLQSRVSSNLVAVNQALAGKANTSAITDLIAAVSVAASRADLEVVRNRPPGSREKPGDGADAYTLVTQIAQLAGDAVRLSPLTANDLAANTAGSTLRVSGNGILASREAVPVETGRIRELRTVVSRFVNSPDPNNDSVRIGVAWLDRFKQVISTGVAFDIADLLVASGRLTRTAYVSASAGPGITLVAPAGAAYFRPFVQMFGAGALTDVEILVATDATGLTVPPPASTDLVADVAALKSQNPGDRLTALETAVNTPNSVTFATRNDAAGGLIPSTATTVQTRGATSPGDGDHALYRRVASLAASEEGFVNSRDNSSWLRVTGSVLNSIVTWGASPLRAAAQNTDAIQRCFNWCRDNDQDYFVPAGRYPVNIGLNVWTGGGGPGTLVAVNASTAGPDPIVTIRPRAADVTSIPVEFFNNLTMVEGRSEDVAWAPYYGCFCVWKTTSQKMLNHATSPSNYALADSIVVHQPDGKFSPAYSWTKDRTWTTLTALGAGSGAWAEKIRRRIRCEINVEYASGTSGEAECAIAVARSNTELVFTVFNETSFPVRQGVRVLPTTNVEVVAAAVKGLQGTTTNYSIQTVTAINVTVRGGISLNGRRSFDGNENTRGVVIIGGEWTDGVGGHFMYGLSIIGGAYITSDLPNSAPLFLSGGDLFIDETCTVRLRPEHGSVFATRNDGFELRGNLIIRCNIEIDCTARPDSTRRVIQLLANTAADFDWGRPVYMPDYIELTSKIRQIGGEFTAGIELLTMFDTTNTYAQPVRGGGRMLIAPKLVYDVGPFLADGVTPRSSVIVTKSAKQWTEGTGYDITLADMPAVAFRSRCTADRTDNGQRINLYTRSIGTLRHFVAPGSYKRLALSAEAFTFPIGLASSRDLSGRTAFADDEVESRDGAFIARTRWAPGSIPAGGSVTVEVPMVGVSPNDRLAAVFGAAQGTQFDCRAGYGGANIVQVRLINNTTATVPFGEANLIVYRWQP